MPGPRPALLAIALGLGLATVGDLKAHGEEADGILPGRRTMRQILGDLRVERTTRRAGHERADRMADPQAARLGRGLALRQAKREATLARHLGLNFDADVARNLILYAPSFDVHYRALLAAGPPPRAGEARPEILTLYRGINLASVAGFQPNYGVLEHADQGDLGGSLYMSTERDIAEGYGNFVVTYQIPRLLLNRGKNAGYYYVGTSELIAAGIRDMRAFQKSIEPSRKTATP